MSEIHLFKLTGKHTLMMTGPAQGYSSVSITIFEHEGSSIELAVHVGGELVYVSLVRDQKFIVRFSQWGGFAEVSYVGREGDQNQVVILRIQTIPEITFDLVEGA